jgi:hypothetical protein
MKIYSPNTKIRLIEHSLGNRLVLQALNILSQVLIAYPDKWYTMLSSVDLKAPGVPALSVRPGGQYMMVL